MKTLRPTFCILSLLLSSTLVSHSQPVDKQEDEVTKPDGVDFIHHSHISQAGERYQVERFIKNKSAKEYLCVEWLAGEIYCTGTHQLAPGATAYSPAGQTTKSRTPEDSKIRYGLKLQHVKENAKVHVHYIDPADKLMKVVSEFSIQDSKGRPVSNISVTSELHPDKNSSELTFEVINGLNLVLPGRLTQFNMSSADKESSWVVSKESRLTAVLKGDETLLASAAGWLRDDDSNPITLKNPGTLRLSRISFTIQGTESKRWSRIRVPILGFENGKTGAVGTIVDIHVPEK